MMIWKSIVRPRAIAPGSARWSAITGFARATAETVSDFASIVHNLVMDVRDTYRPELHYMRGPGPKWRAKHQPWLKSCIAGRAAPVVAGVCKPSQHGYLHPIAGREAPKYGLFALVEASEQEFACWQQSLFKYRNRGGAAPSLAR